MIRGAFRRGSELLPGTLDESAGTIASRTGLLHFGHLIDLPSFSGLYVITWPHSQLTRRFSDAITDLAFSDSQRDSTVPVPLRNTSGYIPVEIESLQRLQNIHECRCGFKSVKK